MAARATIGAGKALSLGVDPLVFGCDGRAHGLFRRVIRDVLAGQPSVLLKREIYVTAAILAGGLFVALKALGLAPIWAGLVGGLAGFALRAGAIQFGWALPAFAMKSA
ncbi:MAG: hypothetical protein HC882_08775 [Acidobacteria bacterium]|nr:hypothetical protein [Acidobacteriota bacterium]